MTAGEILVPVEDEPAFAALMQDYMAEMTRYVDVRHERYPTFDSYWTEPELHWPFWLKVDDTNAGFALVRRNVQAGRTEMAESFVAPRFRRQGVGLPAARRLIGRHPGRWSITERENNIGGIAFWHRVLDGFIAYDETTTATDAVRREQRFTVA
jgi:predicted acetyltransferase